MWCHVSWSFHTQKCDSPCCEHPFIWESSRNYKIFQVFSQICLWLIQILLIWMPTWCLNLFVFPWGFHPKHWHNLLSGTVAHEAGFCPILSAPVPPLQPGIVCIWKGWVFPAAESMDSPWMGAEGTMAHFRLLLVLLLDGKQQSSLPFLGKALCLLLAKNQRGWLKWPPLLPPGIRKSRVSCPRAQVRAAPGLCPPMRGSDGAQAGTGAQEQPPWGRACTYLQVVRVRATLVFASGATSNSFPRAMKSLKSASGAILRSLWPLGCPTCYYMAADKSCSRESWDVC